jgi:hypothetical protein
MSRPNVPEPRELCRAVEDLRCTHSALIMAAGGIAATLHHSSGDDGGVYHLLMAVAEKMDRAVIQLEQLTNCT